jgi:hypothetical protein
MRAPFVDLYDGERSDTVLRAAIAGYDVAPSFCEIPNPSSRPLPSKGRGREARLWTHPFGTAQPLPSSDEGQPGEMLETCNGQFRLDGAADRKASADPSAPPEGHIHIIKPAGAPSDP